MRTKWNALEAAAAALAGFLLQLWCQSSAYEAITRLVTPQHPAMVTLIAFTVIVPLLALIAALPLREKPVAPKAALCAGLDTPYRVVGIAAGAVTFLGGLLQFWPQLLDFLTVRTPAQLGLCAVALLLCAGGVCMVLLSLRPAGRSRSLCTVLPGFAVCFWLITFYHTQSKDPVVSHYGWTLVCLMASALALYHQAGYDFSAPKPVRAQLFSMTAAIYAFLALPAGQQLSEQLLLMGLGIWMLLNTLRVPEVSAPAFE